MSNRMSEKFSKCETGQLTDFIPRKRSSRGWQSSNSSADHFFSSKSLGLDNVHIDI